MNLYVYHKVYDTSFGDIVPVVIYRVTNMNLIIVENGQSSRDNCIIVQAPTCPFVSYENSVFLYKSGAHYDGVVINFEHNAKLTATLDKYRMLPHDVMIYCEMPTRASSHADLHESYISPVNGCRDIRKSHGDKLTIDTSGDIVSNPSDCNTGCHAINAIYPGQRNVHSFTAKNVKFCSWNICGLYDHKLCDDMLGPFLKLHDIIFITEKMGM